MVTSADLLIVKVGGSLFSDKMTDRQLDEQALQTYAQLMASLYRNAPGHVIMISGGGSYGHHAVRCIDESDELSLLSLGMINFELKCVWHEQLKRCGIKSYPLHLASMTSCVNRENFDSSAKFVNKLLYAKYLPLVTGDALLNEQGVLEVVGSDYVAGAFKDLEFNKIRIVIMTDVPGVLQKSATGQFETIKEIDQFNDPAQWLWETPEGDTSGAMQGKIAALLKQAKWGAECFIVEGQACLKNPRWLFEEHSDWPEEFKSTQIIWRENNAKDTEGY
ncbi:hypothetical protein [Pseudoalteromonas byunsanensis]|uniref:Aspartate/glutamate/uridylate kinase domain-containing protein n=2 Tax=Pseudoalteromonas byunsanensis TaxID=327939 RepID=A0A1S1N6Z6_9GAMM|nr:hypothetical protein BIW53_10710 [Pseudoalteromonas byunsanensis]